MSGERSELSSQLLRSGLLSGSIYALVALGLALMNGETLTMHELLTKYRNERAGIIQRPLLDDFIPGSVFYAYHIPPVRPADLQTPILTSPRSPAGAWERDKLLP